MWLINSIKCILGLCIHKWEYIKNEVSDDGYVRVIKRCEKCNKYTYKFGYIYE